MTVIEKLFEEPVQPFEEGVTRMVAIEGILLLFRAVKDGIFPVPALTRPMLVLSFVQAKAVPLTDPV